MDLICGGRAIVLMSSIFKLLTYLQEQKELVITSKVINEYLDLGCYH